MEGGQRTEPQEHQCQHRLRERMVWRSLEGQLQRQKRQQVWIVLGDTQERVAGAEV